MITPTVSITYGGRPMEVLNQLLEKRQKWLRESGKDGVVATAITALQSIRKDTKAHRSQLVKIDGLRVRIEERADVHTSHTKGGVRCYRRGTRTDRRAPRVDLGRTCVQLVPPADKAWRDASVFRVTISAEQKERWPFQPLEFNVAASSYKAVESYVRKRLGHIAKREGGLARHVLSLAMQQLSTRPPAKGKVGEAAQKTAKRFLDVATYGSGDAYTVQIRDNLSYAVDAVKGGASGIDFALKRAANRIAGMIRHRAGARLDEDIPTPFPEVKRK